MASERRVALWSQTVGTKPCSLTVYEQSPGGLLMARVWVPAERRYRKVPLGHRDKAKALAWAQEQVADMAAGRASEGLVPGVDATTTVRGLLVLYRVHRLPQKKPAQRQEDSRRIAMWVRLLGERAVAGLGAAEWDDFIRRRRSGAIDQHGRAVRNRDEWRAVGDRAIDADLMFLVTVFNWACQFPRPGRSGLMLLERNPWGGAGHGVKRLLARPRNRRVKRPVATTTRYDATMAHAHAVTTLVPVDAAVPGAVRRRRLPGYVAWAPTWLAVLLLVVYHSGRRIAAVCALTRDRLVWNDTPTGRAIVAVRWPPLKDETELDVPVAPVVGAALALHLQRVDALGAAAGLAWGAGAPVFPAVRELARWQPGGALPGPMTRWTARDWLRGAEQAAGLPALDGGCWHPYRRSWAVRRKHLPARDRMYIAGWKDRATMEASYEQPDDASIRRVLTEDVPLP